MEDFVKLQIVPIDKITFTYIPASNSYTLSVNSLNKSTQPHSCTCY